MRLSKLLGSRYKERPADAVTDSHALLLRGAYIRPVSNGLFALLPPGVRVMRKLESLWHAEMARLGVQEVQTPFVQPAEAPDAAERRTADTWMRATFKDRSGNELALCGARERALISLCRGELRSHAQLPLAVYTIQPVFRDEPRSRGGLLQAREFSPLEALAFVTHHAESQRWCGLFRDACRRVFDAAGLTGVMVAASAGRTEEGGEVFLFPCDAGEDLAAACDTCGYCATIDAATGQVAARPAEPRPLERVHTPGLKTIREVAAYVGVDPWQAAKAVIYDRDADGRLAVLIIRGDVEVNEAKLERLIGVPPEPASEARILACGAVPGFATGMGLDPAKCRIIVDHSVAHSNNLVCGANEVDWHYLNFNLQRDLPGITTVDVAQVADGFQCPRCAADLRIRHGVVLGGIAASGVMLTEPMNMRYLDESGVSRTPCVVRCTAGVGRLLCAVIETRHDKFGPIWPPSIAPWQVHLHALKASEPALRAAADQLYEDLRAAGIETLYDDRNLSPGIQFADADLLGAPIRLIVSGKHLANHEAEYRLRGTGESGVMPLAGAVSRVRGWLEQ